MSVKRAAIYVIYDKDGKLDRYRKYYLEKIRKFCDKIVCVIQGTLEPESRRELENLCDDFFVRENTGFLTYGWIEGINFIGWDTLKDYDELLMLNDSFFGPFFELDDFFNACEKSDADFYGALKNFEVNELKEMQGRQFKHGFLRGSICYFYVIKSRLLHSIEFKKYWGQKPLINNDYDTFFFNEFDFYDYVVDSGFKVDSYQSDRLKGYFWDNLTHNITKLVKFEKNPFARIRPLGSDLKCHSLKIGLANDPRNLIEYLDKNTKYDTSMIWEYLLRTKNLFHIWNQMQLEYVVHDSIVEKEYTYNKKIAVILHIYYTDLVESVLNYCLNFPQNTDFYISTIHEDTEEKINKLFSEKKLKFVCKRRRNVGVALSSLWVTYADVVSNGEYEYICYFHDKKSPYKSVFGQCAMQGEQFAERLYQNLFGTKEVVKNIINLFEENKKMGILGVPDPYHGIYFLATILTWKGNYPKTVELAKRLGLHVDIDEKLMAVAPYGDMFWFRSKALKKAIDNKLTYDFFDEPYKPDYTIMHAFERIYGYCAQDSGYYYADVITNNNARTDLINYQYLIYQSNGLLPNSELFQMCWQQKTADLHNYINQLNQQVKNLSEIINAKNQHIEYQNKLISQQNQHIQYQDGVIANSSILPNSDANFISFIKTNHVIKRHIKSDLRKSILKRKLFFFWPSKKSHYLGKINKCKYMLSLMEQ